MVSNPPSLVLIDPCDLFQRKHNMIQYFGLDGIDFGAIL